MNHNLLNGLIGFIPLGILFLFAAFSRKVVAGQFGDNVTKGIIDNIPLGIRNNNPGNIRTSNDKWRGAVGKNKGFVVFSSPELGIRALTKLLVNYWNRYNLRTIEQIISRYAPGNENDTQSYINYVAYTMGYKPWDQLNFPTDLPGLVNAIILFENGNNPYKQETIIAGLDMGTENATFG